MGIWGWVIDLESIKLERGLLVEICFFVDGDFGIRIWFVEWVFLRFFIN